MTTLDALPQSDDVSRFEMRTTKSSHRQGLHTVHSLDLVVFAVPRLDQAAHFYTAFGLDVRSHSGRVDLHTAGHPHRWVSIFEGGSAKQLQYLRFACFANDIEAIAARASDSGHLTDRAHRLGEAGSIWLRHPDGLLVQVVVGPKSSPDATSAPLPVEPAEVGVGRSPSRSRVRQVRPRRLSHALLFSPDTDRAISFFADVLGLRVTDRSGDAVVFMHGAHGSDHHLVGLGKSSGPGLHHLSWDVGSIDEVGLGMEQMQRAGYTRGWGVGRHVLGSNYFYYARDPWGSHCEYSFDMDFVPGDHDWRARDHLPEDSFYVWGPPVPEDFSANFETHDA